MLKLPLRPYPCTLTPPRSVPPGLDCPVVAQRRPCASPPTHSDPGTCQITPLAYNCGEKAHNEKGGKKQTAPRAIALPSVTPGGILRARQASRQQRNSPEKDGNQPQNAPLGRNLHVRKRLKGKQLQDKRVNRNTPPGSANPLHINNMQASAAGKMTPPHPPRTNRRFYRFPAGKYPGPRSTFPGSAPVIFPWAITATPFTSTYSMPTES